MLYATHPHVMPGVDQRCVAFVHLTDDGEAWVGCSNGVMAHIPTKNSQAEWVQSVIDAWLATRGA